LASSINHKVAEGCKEVVLRTIGAGALNQATKAVIVANKNLSSQGLEAIMRPYYKKIEELTCIELKLEIKER